MMRAMAKILKLFWPKSFHLLCFLFLYLQWRWIVDMKCEIFWSEDCLYIATKFVNVKPIYRCIFNVEYRNNAENICEVFFITNTFQPALKGEVLRVENSGREARDALWDSLPGRRVKCWNNCGCLGVCRGRGRGTASSAGPHPSMDCQPQARPVCTTAVMHPLSLFTSDKCEKE